MNARIRVLMVAACVAAAAPRPAVGSPPSVWALSPVVYAVCVNGAPVAAGALLLATPARDLYVRIDDLRTWRINVPAGIADLIRGGAHYVALRAIPGLTIGFDTATQTLLLRAGPSSLRPTELRLDPAAPVPVARPVGAFVNYAFSLSGGTYASAPAGELQTGVAALNGIIKNDAAWTPGTFSRLGTSWERDDPLRMQSIVVGDTTTTDVDLGSALRFAGVQWGTDFSEQPQFATYPGVTVRGAASVPSTLDVYVNDVLAFARDVPAGPYTLRDLPLSEGAGSIAVRATGITGDGGGFVTPFYQARNLLEPGLAAFSYGAGFLDANGSYGPFIVDASRRWGITRTFTGGLMGQFSGRDVVAGFNSDVLAGTAGEVSVATALSRSPAGIGTLYDIGYDYTGRRLAFGGDYRVAGAAYTTLDPTAIAIGHQADLHASVRLTRVTSAQLSIARDATVDGPITLWTLSVAGNTAGFPYSLTAYKTAGASADAFGLTAALTLPIGRHATLSPRAGTGSNSAQSQLEYAGTVGNAERSLSWDLAAGMSRSATSTARITADGGVGEFDFDAAAGPGESNYTTRLAGGVAIVGDEIAATPQITGSFGLVRVPGVGGIDVYVNGQYAGKTDARGDLLTANLAPFVENEIRIDPARLAPSLHVDVLVKTIVPSALGGTTVIFPARVEAEARLTLRDGRGMPLPPGTVLAAAGTTQTWPVGLDGHADLIGVAPGPLVLRATLETRSCTIRLEIPATPAIARLADAQCL